MAEAGSDLASIVKKPSFNKVFDRLQAFAKNNPTARRAKVFASKDAFLKKFESLHKASKNGVGSLEDVTKHFDNLIEKYSDIPNIDRYIDEMFQSSSKFKGGAFGLEILNDLPPSLNKKLFKFEASIDDLAADMVGCRFDLKFKDNIGVILVETKNYAKNTPFSKSFYKQFKAYIGNDKLKSIDDIKYFFKSNAGITKADRVKKFKSMLLKENRYETIFNSNKELFKSTGIKDANQFKYLLMSDNATHSFFNFVEIY